MFNMILQHEVAKAFRFTAMSLVIIHVPKSSSRTEGHVVLKTRSLRSKSTVCEYQILSGLQSADHASIEYLIEIIWYSAFVFFSGFCLCKWLFSVLDWCCRQGGQNLPGDRMVKWIQRIWFWNYRSKHAEFYFSHFDWLSVFLLHIILTLYVQVLKRLSDEIGESLLTSLFTMIFPH